MQLTDSGVWVALLRHRLQLRLQYTVAQSCRTQNIRAVGFLKDPASSGRRPPAFMEACTLSLAPARNASLSLVWVALVRLSLLCLAPLQLNTPHCTPRSSNPQATPKWGFAKIRGPFDNQLVGSLSSAPTTRLQKLSKITTLCTFPSPYCCSNSPVPKAVKAQWEDPPVSWTCYLCALLGCPPLYQRSLIGMRIRGTRIPIKDC